MNASVSPRGEIRIFDTYPAVSYSTWPTGNSSRWPLLDARTTATAEPSADRAASNTPSITSRAAPPTSDDRASVPLATGEFRCDPTSTAISPDEDEVASSLASGKSRDLDSVVSVRVVNT